jgi:hypothetical protein
MLSPRKQPVGQAVCRVAVCGRFLAQDPSASLPWLPAFISSSAYLAASKVTGFFGGCVESN